MLIATLLDADFTTDVAEAVLTLRFEHDGMEPMDRRFAFRRAADLSPDAIKAWIADEIVRIEGLLSRAAELEQAVGADVCRLLDDAGGEDPDLEVTLAGVGKTYDAVTLDLDVHLRKSKTVSRQSRAFADPGQMSRRALQALVATEKARMVGLSGMSPGVAHLVGTDLAAWSRGET